MPHAKRSSAGNMHGGRPGNSPGLRRGQTVWAACPPFAFNRHCDRRLTWPWPSAPPWPAITVAMRVFISNNAWK